MAYILIRRRRRMGVLGMLLGFLLSATAHSHTCAPIAETVPLSETQYLDVSFHSGNDRSHTGKQNLFARVMIQNGHLAEHFPVSVASHPLFPLSDFSVVGKWWNLIGELAANPGISWSYKDHFVVYDKGLKYEIDRQALSRYPDLQRRLAAARPSFDRIEIDVYGVHDLKQSSTARAPRIKLIVTSNDVIVPPERQAPYMVPMSPPKWSDRLRIGDLEGPALLKEWGNIKGIRCPLVSVYNLRVPTGLLAGIAKDFKRYSEQDRELDKRMARTEKGFKLNPSDRGYSGPAKYLEPLVAPPQFAEVVHSGNQISLKAKSKPGSPSNGRTLFTTRDYDSVSAVDGEGRYFIFRLRNGDHHILNAAGRKISIAGFDTFSSAGVDKEGEKLHLYPSSSSRQPIYTTKFFYQRSFFYQRWPARRMSLEEFDQFKRADSLQPCPYRGGLMAPWGRHDFHRLRLISTDAQLNVIFDGDVVVLGDSHPSRTGDRVCR